MTVYELYDALSEKIPKTLSEPWDNDGLMCCPDGTRTVTRVLLALDVTDAVVEHAVSVGAELIVSHHPLIFSPLSSLGGEDPVERRVLRLVSSGIAVFSFHTRLDRAEGGVNDTLASQLRLQQLAPLGEGEASLGRVGTLPAKMTVEDFAEYVKLALGVPFVQVWDAGRPVSRVALVGGEGKDFLPYAEACGADTYLSGRIGYHRMQDSPLNLLEAGHYFTERQVTVALADMLRAIGFAGELEIYTPNPLAVY